MSKHASISAMLPAHQRIEKTLETIRRLKDCDPPPAEILVHVAASQIEMRKAVEDRFPDCRILISEENLGPGGARNRMIREARNELVASFDDDSYPVQGHFFASLADWFQRLPEASIFALNIYETGHSEPDGSGEPVKTPHFVGCGCAYRRSHFLEGKGYVPIPIAYSMEEADLAMRYIDRGRDIFYIPNLLVFHDTVLSHHASPKVAAMQVANVGLLVYLRYPVSRWIFGLGQVLHKWMDTIRRKRIAGALLSVPGILYQICKYHKYRDTVSVASLETYRQCGNERE